MRRLMRALLVLSSVSAPAGAGNGVGPVATPPADPAEEAAIQWIWDADLEATPVGPATVVALADVVVDAPEPRARLEVVGAAQVVGAWVVPRRPECVQYEVNPRGP